MQVDGDGQHDPRDIPRLLAALQADPAVEMITGSRFLDAAQPAGYRSSPLRRVGIRIFAALMSLITRQRVTDPTSGFRMSGRSGIELFARDYPPDYPEVEAILLMHAHRLRCAEVAVSMRPRIERALGDRGRDPGVLHGQGAARRIRRPAARAADGRARGAASVSVAPALAALVATAVRRGAPSTLDRVAVIAIAVLVVRGRDRACPPPAHDGALRAAVACRGRDAARCSRYGRGC